MKYNLTFFLILISFSLFGQSLSGVPTFECVSLYGSGLSNGKIQYREKGTEPWLNGLDLWQDSRAIGGRSAGEWRGSVVGLKPGTTYEFQAGGATINVSTWSEVFNVGSTGTLSGNISSGGTASAYKLYTGNYNGDITINASYVILRGCKITGATNDAIVINGHHVVIENCDISGWGQPASTLGGNNQAAIRTKFNASVINLVIQRNKIHNPRNSASGWTSPTDGSHPYGVSAINLEGSGGNHVIRYNDIYSDSANPQSFRFMDGIGGADNFTYTGAPGANSDIYGNNVTGCYDDAIEAEGGGMNVRIWGNWTNYTFTGIATATVSVGPMYVFNNISNVGTRMSNVTQSEDRGPFNKCGGNNQSQYTGGRTYLFHNTVLQPQGNRGLCGGIVESGGKVTNVISKNNIWTSAFTNYGGLPINLFQGGSANSENDLFSPNTTGGSVTKSGSITSAPTYASTVGLTQNPSGYFLSGTVGKGKAVSINNFNNAGEDVGAYHANKKLEFGTEAYKGTTPPPIPNETPTVSASVDRSSITLPTNSVTLTGTASDPDGSVIRTEWSLTSGPATYSLGSPLSLTTSASNLVQGTYRFRLTVTDDKGATAFAETSVIVLAAPPDPTKVFPVYQDINVKMSDSTIKKFRIVF